MFVFFFVVVLGAGVFFMTRRSRGKPGGRSFESTGPPIEPQPAPPIREAPSSETPPLELQAACRAELIYKPGTPGEVSFPITTEMLTVGRGRDNDVHIKNDSKVSRYNTRLFLQDGRYHIADNRSSNGTIVNEELISQRELTGGEEIIIGETFFRFVLHGQH